MMTLQEFIDKHFQLCSYRGIDPLNPIDFIIQPSANVNQTWTLLCSVSEPTFSRVAYNILWMPLDPADSNYKKILIRKDHETNNMGYRSFWEVIDTYENLWKEVQYWIPVITDPFLLGITDLNEGIGPATTQVLGLAYLEGNPVDPESGLKQPVSPIAIEHNDIRMSNPRYPNFHTHPDYARTKIKINDTQYALVSTSFVPEAGMLLFIEGVNPENSNEFIAVWRYPRSADITFIDRSLVSIMISGANIVDEQSVEQYEVWATFADGATRKVTPNVFKNVQNTSSASITINGVLTTNDIAVDSNITLEASYTFKGITKIAQKPVTVVAGLEVLSIEILGSDEVLEKTTSNPYSVRASFSDNTQSIVTPQTFTSSNTVLAPLNASRSIVATEANGDTQIVLTATYMFAGKTVNATKPVLIKEEPVVPVSLAILGPSPSTMLEGTNFTFKFRVSYSNGDQVVKDVINSFSSTNNSVLSVAQTTTAVGTAGLVTANTTVRLNGTYVEGGTTVSASLDVLVTDVAVPTSAEIFNGLTTFFENQPQVYRGRIKFDNNTTITVNDSTKTVWSIVNGASYVTIAEHPTDGSLVLTPNDITADQSVRIRLVATYNGQDFTVEQNLTIRARLNTPNTLKIFEENILPANFDSAVSSIDINAGSSSKFKFAAKMSFTPTQWSAINASDTKLTFSIASPNYGVTVVVDDQDPTKVKVEVPSDLPQNRSVQLIASYTNDGSSANASYTINAKVVSTDITPRFGIAPTQQLVADYGTPAFYNLLTGSLTGVNGEQFSVGIAEDMDHLGYMMYPKEWGYIYIQNTSDLNYGGWDGGKITYQDGTFGSPAEVTVNGKAYYIYRMTFPGYTVPTTWKVVKYNSSTPDSHLP
jgi:hypothetical protein